MAKDERKARWQEITRPYDRGMIASTAILARRYVDDYPRDGALWVYYGAASGRLSRYDEAVPAFRRAERLLPPEYRALVYFHRGQTNERKGALSRVAPWHRKGIEVAGSEADHWILLGIALHRAGELEEAERTLRRATRCREGAIEEAWLNLAYVYVTQGRYSKAEQCVERAFAIDANYSEAKLMMTDLEYVKKRLPSA